MKDADVFRSNPDFIFREIAGEYILVPVGKAAERFSGLAALNGTGRFLWELLSRERTFRELYVALAAEYDLTEEAGRQDAADFLRLALSQNAVLACG